MGITLGDDFISKWTLASMLPRLKLQGALGNESGKNYSTRLRIGRFTSTVYFRDQDIFIFHDVFSGDGYLRSEMYKAPPRCIVDLGAHIGLATLKFAASFPEALIHCYEPDPENFSLLEANTAMLQNVIMHNEAVGPRSEKAVLHVNPGSRASSSLKRESGENRTHEVECTVKSLDEIISTIGEDVDLIKFDIEGRELETFASSSLVQGVRHLVGEMKADIADIGGFVRMFPKHKHQIERISKKMHLVHLQRV